MPKAAPEKILEEVQKAMLKAAVTAFEQMGDRGPSGGFILEVDGRTKLARHAIKVGAGYKSLNGVQLRQPEGYPDVQNQSVHYAAVHAAKAVLVEHGVKIKRSYSFVD